MSTRSHIAIAGLTVVALGLSGSQDIVMYGDSENFLRARHVELSVEASQMLGAADDMRALRESNAKLRLTAQRHEQDLARAEARIATLEDENAELQAQLAACQQALLLADNELTRLVEAWFHDANYDEQVKLAREAAGGVRQDAEP